MTSPNTLSANEPARSYFSAHSTANTNDKSTISGRMSCIGISDVVNASVYLEKTV